MTTDDGAFQYEDCLLKHHIRTSAWLPLCKDRLKLLRHNRKPKQQRRLRYFTFCAVGAIDVLMLEIARVIRKSADGHLDTVYFFDKTPDLVDMTAKRIPGAIGFPGNFVDILLADDPNGDDPPSPEEALLGPANEEDTAATRQKQVALATRRSFINSFPFDVINLDLEGYLFRPTDRLPGRLINALRKVFAWQRRPLRDAKGTAKEVIDGFSLMFTTKVGPANLGDDYLEMLRDYLRDNITSRPTLVEHLEARTGSRDLATIEAGQFDAFFKLAAPKLLAAILHAEDWFINSGHGIDVYEFERPSQSGPYKMLHLVMHAQRKRPPVEQRGPGQDSPEAQEAYAAVVERLFTKQETTVADATIDTAELQASLDAIKAHRRRTYPEGE